MQTITSDATTERIAQKNHHAFIYFYIRCIEK